MSLSILIPNLRPNRHNRRIDPEHVAQLAGSMNENGQWQPIMVRELLEGVYEIIAGHHRVEAARSLGWAEIRAELWAADDETADALVIDTNLKAKALSPDEEADAIQALMDRYGWTQERVAQRFGKTQKWISERLSLNRLTPAVRELIPQGKLDASHAVHISRAPEELQERIARRVVEADMNRADTAQLTSLATNPEAPADVKEAALKGNVAPAVAVALAQVKDTITRQGLLADASKGRLTPQEAQKEAAAANRRTDGPVSVLTVRVHRRLEITKYVGKVREALEEIGPDDVYDADPETLKWLEHELQAIAGRLNKLGTWRAAAMSKPANQPPKGTGKVLGFKNSR